MGFVLSLLRIIIIYFSIWITLLRLRVSDSSNYLFFKD